MNKANWFVKKTTIYWFVIFATLSMPLTAMADLTGYIMNIDGIPINGAIITTSAPSGDVTFSTGQDGYYCLHDDDDDLSNSSYYVTITLFGYKDTRGYYKYKKQTRNYYLELRSFQEYFVNPASGSVDDMCPGTENEPFATLEQARNAIRSDKLNAGSKWNGAEVYLRGKTDETDKIYYRKQSFELMPEDSGTVDAPVIYKAYPGEEVRIVGGVQLNGNNFTPVVDVDGTTTDAWDRLDDNVEGLVYQIDLLKNGVEAIDLGDLKERGLGIYNPPGALELFVDQKPMQLARWPEIDAVNYGFVKTEGDVSESTMTFQYPTDSRPDLWKDAPDLWLHGFWKMSSADLSMRGKVDSVNKTITLTKPENYKDLPEFGLEKDMPYFAENLLEEITQPGEWYLDRQNLQNLDPDNNTAMLYFYPDPNIDMNTIEIMVSTLGNPLVDINGASNVSFENLTFEIARGELVNIDADPSNPDNVATNNQFYNCVFRNAGSSGVIVKGTGNGIEHSQIYNIGDQGVRLWGGDVPNLLEGGNFIRNSYIHHVGRLTFTNKPGISLVGVGQVASHNEIYSIPSMGIRFWGNEHLIESNDIHDVLTLMADNAAIYAGRNWGFRGNIIKHNYIHDIPPNMWEPKLYTIENQIKGGYLLFGIYLDDCISGITVFGNVFDNIAGAAIFHGGGRDNIMDNNIMVKCGAAFWTDNRGMRRIEHPVHNEDAYDLFEDLKMDTDDFLHITDTWKLAYPALESMGTDWETIWTGDWRQPENCVFTRNAGYSNIKEIVYFQNEERRNPDDTETELYPLRGVTYPLNFFDPNNKDRSELDVLADVLSENYLAIGAFSLHPADGNLSVPGLDIIPIGDVGPDWAPLLPQ